MNEPTQQMRILMTTDTLGGVWTYVLELARSLATYPCQIALATMGGAMRPSQAQEAAELPNLTVYESDYKLEWMDDPWDDVDASIEWLAEIEREFKPNLIQLNGYAHGARKWSAPTLVVAHSCVFSWWTAVHGERPPRTWDIYQQRVEAGLNGADLVVAPTHAMLAAVQRHYAFQTPAQVIYNGRQLYQPERATKNPFIFTMGRIWDEAKNIAALNAIADQCNWSIYVAGDDNHPEGGKSSLTSLKALGYLSNSEIAEWLRSASIYAMPARYEPFGLSILEAALSRCALVLGDIDSLRELWDGAAEFVDPDDTNALRRTLTRLAENEPYRLAMAQAAHRRARTYTSQAMGAAYWRTYCSLLKRPDLDQPVDAGRAPSRVFSAQRVPVEYVNAL